MKFKNPNFRSQVDTWLENNRANVEAYFGSLDASEMWIDFDQVRADLPGLADRLTDGVIEEIARSLGLEVAE